MDVIPASAVLGSRVRMCPPTSFVVRTAEARAARIDALAPDRSRLSVLPREMSEEMRKGEQRIAGRRLPEVSRATALRQLLANSARVSGNILWGT